jgi:hypothetical protein
VLRVEQSPISPLYLPYISPTSLLYLPYISPDLARVLRVEQPPLQRAEPVVVRAFRVRVRVRVRVREIYGRCMGDIWEI